MAKESLQYITKEEQYKGMDLTAIDYVQAQYVRSVNVSYQGNRFIEAIPVPRTRYEAVSAYTKTLSEFDGPNERRLSKEERIRQVSRLREVRVPVGYQNMLEERIYTAICESYKKRYLVCSDKKVDDDGSNALLMGEVISDACIGFSLVGNSGCGKTSSLKTVLSNFPQSILHEGEGIRIRQIPYLFVTCSAHSNMSNLLDSIGRAVDIAIRVTDNRYENAIRRNRKIGDKCLYIQRLVEHFAIGIIIFDEIQEMSFSSLDKNSFHPMLTISERCRMAFGYVGTDSSLDKLTEDAYIARRAGQPIIADKCKKDRKTFARFFDALQAYQWVSTPSKFSTVIDGDKFKSSTVEKLFMYSGGIFDRAVTLYSFMQIDSIRRDRPMGEEQLLSIMDEYFPNMFSTKTKKIRKIDDAKLEKMFKDVNERMLLEQDAKEEMAFEECIEKNREETDSVRDRLFEEIWSAIDMCGLSDSKQDVMSICQKLYMVKKNRNLSKKEFMSLVKERLVRKPSRRKISKVAEHYIDSNLSKAMNAGKDLI